MVYRTLLLKANQILIETTTCDQIGGSKTTDKSHTSSYEVKQNKNRNRKRIKVFVCIAHTICI